MEDFYQKKSGEREPLAKEEKGSFLGQDIFLWGVKKWGGFYHANYVFIL